MNCQKKSGKRKENRFWINTLRSQGPSFPLPLPLFSYVYILKFYFCYRFASTFIVLVNILHAIWWTACLLLPWSSQRFNELQTVNRNNRLPDENSTVIFFFFFHPNWECSAHYYFMTVLGACDSEPHKIEQAIWQNAKFKITTFELVVSKIHLRTQRITCSLVHAWKSVQTIFVEALTFSSFRVFAHRSTQ